MVETSDWATELSGSIRNRALQYGRLGVGETEATVAALREAGYLHEDIAERLDITEDDVEKVHRKFQSETCANALSLAIGSLGGSKWILSMAAIQDGTASAERWLVVKPINSQRDIADAMANPPKGEVVLTKVFASQMGFTANSTVHDSVREMLDDTLNRYSATDTRSMNTVDRPEDEIPYGDAKSGERNIMNFLLQWLPLND